MKIKKHGEIPKWELDVTCKRCKAVITLEDSEDMYSELTPNGTEDGPNRTGYTSIYYFTCPECKEKNKVSARKIREDIRKELDAKHALRF